MDESGLVEEGKTVEQLLGKDSDQSRAETAELILLYEFIQVDTEQFKDEAKMLAMDKSILESQKVVIVVFVELGVELGGKLATRLSQWE